MVLGTANRPSKGKIFLKTSVETDVTAMFLGIINVILVPIVLGILINKFFGSFTQKFVNLEKIQQDLVMNCHKKI